MVMVYLLTFDIQGDKTLIDKCGVGVMDSAANQLTVVHSFGCESKCARHHCCVAFLQIVWCKNRIRKIVCVHPVDLRSHIGTVIWSIAGQVQALITDYFFGNVNIGLV